MNKTTASESLAFFRIVFGGLLLASALRFAAMGWIQELYVDPKVFLPFFGLEWIKPLGFWGMHGLFAVMALSALGIMLGLFYRWSALLFFLSFTYVELIDKSNYLNHYYFVSLMSFLMIWVPANCAFSLDGWLDPKKRGAYVPRWSIDLLKFQIGVVYFFAGVAKLNGDWVFEALPLRIWLPAQSHLPLLGDLLTYPETAFLFSWFGAVYDLSIAFFLLWSRTRILAFVAVVVFHLATWMLFPIGMFPFIMIANSLLFFSSSFHKKVLNKIGSWLSVPPLPQANSNSKPSLSWPSGLGFAFIALYVLVQLALPFRYVLYPGHLFWHEQGFRFSWRLMLMEKAGYAIFTVRDPETGRSWQIRNYDYLTPNQEKMVATQADMLLQFAQHVEQDLRQKGYDSVEIRVQSYVTLNGQPSQLLVDPHVDLTQLKPGWKAKEWILPFHNNRHALFGEQKQVKHP